MDGSDVTDVPGFAQDGDVSAQLRAALARLTLDQLRFVVARHEASSDAEACRMSRISRSTASHWPAEQRALCAEAVRLMAADGIITAVHIRRRNLAKAMAVKVSGLDSADERLRQSVATELIEWELGRATQRQELTGADAGAIVVTWDDILTGIGGDGSSDSDD